jgi:CDGSH-type Zn-finger protein
MSEPRTKARIVVSKEGPYLVTGGVPLAEQVIGTDAEGGSETWEQGKAYETQDSYALCRCGRSRKKPFCDGTHSRVGFDGTETASREPYSKQAEVQDGPRNLRSWMPSISAPSPVSAIRMARSGAGSNAPTTRRYARIFSGRSAIVRPGVWWHGTRMPASRSSQNFPFPSALSRTRLRSAVARSGCGVACIWYLRMASITKCATA